jgi:basic membrane lipoprotein Med (substrate-binding protein (PBP1-ABC) superfamily)
MNKLEISVIKPSIEEIKTPFDESVLLKITALDKSDYVDFNFIKWYNNGEKGNCGGFQIRKGDLRYLHGFIGAYLANQELTLKEGKGE